MKKTNEVHIIEKILYLSEKIKKIGESKIFAKNGITILQFNILGIILGENINTINGIKKKLIVSSASISQTINRMEKSGLIIRELGINDKRETILIPTKKGIEIYQKLNKYYILACKKVFGNIDDIIISSISKNLELIDKTIENNEFNK